MPATRNRADHAPRLAKLAERQYADGDKRGALATLKLLFDLARRENNADLVVQAGAAVRRVAGEIGAKLEPRFRNRGGRGGAARRSTVAQFVDRARAARTFRQRLRGGDSSGRHPREFNRNALIAGVLEELEHTTSLAVALEIAMDHLVKDPHYYTKLARVEKMKRNQPSSKRPKVKVRVKVNVKVRNQGLKWKASPYGEGGHDLNVWTARTKHGYYKAEKFEMGSTRLNTWELRYFGYNVHKGKGISTYAGDRGRLLGVDLRSLSAAKTAAAKHNARMVKQVAKGIIYADERRNKTKRRNYSISNARFWGN